ncbi:hypothetical protein [Aminiphilus circumscriptus]|uniref:hypothetical protein n=1 Tax=Aminiphilus circumscriptus TaxID=290732 RepID=UPI000492A360|nr:hypothetical protein [Aminiphilus circumscriptus]
MRCFYNAKGIVFARLDDDGVLRKSERQRDRLRVTGGRSHAIDESLLDEVLRSGGRLLEITEKGISGETRIFRIPLEDVRRYGKRLTLAGISRWTVPLPCCELVRGPEEEWRLTARNEMLQAETRRDEVQEIRAVQGMLFSDEEKSYWRTRMVHES